MSYGRLIAMVATSTVAMFALMYFNTYALAHLRFSETRVFMALLMGAAMTAIMLGFMSSMYQNRRWNIVILLFSSAIFGVSLWLVRSQDTIGDVAYMKAMIPHHSIAIMTSERAHIKDPRVRQLADGIIGSQEREIAEMERLIVQLEANPSPAAAPDLPPYRARSVSSPPRTDDNAVIGYTKAPL